MNSVREEALRFLKKNNVAVVATVFGGEPYASAVHYVSDDDFDIYFMAQRNTKKYLNISAKQKSSIVVGAGPKHISFQARGIADILVGDEARKVREQFSWIKGSHLIERWPVEEMAKFEGEEPVIFKFEPLEAVFMNLDDEAYPLSLGTAYHAII